jgi:hypothetical protein
MTKKPQAPSPEVADEIAAPSAVEKPDVQEEPVPTHVKLSETPASVLSRIRVIDVATGDVIAKVIEADAAAGIVHRYEVAGGALVLENDRFKTIEEERPVRIEWTTGNQKGSF